MAKAILFLVLLLLGSLICFAQQVKKPSQKNSVKILKNNPSVYLKLLSTLRGKLSSDSNDVSEVVRLAICNNTKWSVSYYIISGPNPNGDVKIRYGVEGEPDLPPIQLGKADTFVEETLRPGQAVTFTAPQDHLSEGYKVYVNFHYNWEDTDGKIISGDEPQHRVYFSHQDLVRSLNGNYVNKH